MKSSSFLKQIGLGLLVLAAAALSRAQGTYEPCAPCCGTGQIFQLCSSCDGQGGEMRVVIEECPVCAGQGCSDDGSMCAACSGTGQYNVQVWVDCDLCCGTGEEISACSSCAGTGTVQVPNEPVSCMDCGGSGHALDLCSSCNGEGGAMSVVIEQCPVCAGQGCFDDGSLCWCCGGMGSFYWEEWQACNSCEGQGLVLCPCIGCGGTGQQ